MGERRWHLTKDGEQERPYLWSDKYRDWLPRDELLPPSPSGPSLTDAEVLAEMPTEAVLREAAKRMADRGWEHTSVLLDQQANQAGKEAADG